MTTRKPFPQWNPLRDYVQAELNRRKSRPAFAPDGRIGDLSGNQYTPAITPFVKLTSCLQDLNGFNYKFFSLGLHGAPETNTADIYELTYGSQDIVGFAYGTDNKAATRSSSATSPRRPITSLQSKGTQTEPGSPALGRHPIPGILHVSINHKGLNDYIEISVTWKCYNAVQLEFLRSHFIASGHYVVLEMGHQYSDLLPLRTFNFGKAGAEVELAKMVVQGRSYINDTAVANAHGNYDIFLGQIMDSEIALQPDATFEVTTQIASKGEAAFSLNNFRSQGDTTRAQGATAYPTNIHDYFIQPGRFDALLASAMRNRDPGVIDAGNPQGAQHRGGSGDIGATDVELQREDTVFISWDFFLKTMMPDLFSHFSGSNISNEIAMFENINQTHENTDDDEPWVGNNPELRSVNADIMVIVKAAAKAEAQKQKLDDLFRNADPFEDPTGQISRGRLSRGIWVRAEFIRLSFLQNQTFLNALKAIVLGMSQASADFWNLDVVWDEDKHRIVVFDHSAVTNNLQDRNGLYTFNRGILGNPAFAPGGELLAMTFNAKYTNEEKIAALLAAHKQKDTVSDNQSVMNGPQPHVTVINSLDTDDGRYSDLLTQAIDSLRTRTSVQPDATQADLANRTVETRVTSQPVTTAPSQQESSTTQQERTTQAQTLAKFADILKVYIDIPSVIKERVRQHGLTNKNTPNNYLAPIPTDVSLDLTIQGIGGMALLDAFLVDKLPKIYTRHGIFLITGLKHEVTREQGWRTSLSGAYYFMHHDPVELERPTDSQQQTEMNSQFTRPSDAITSRSPDVVNNVLSSLIGTP